MKKILLYHGFIAALISLLLSAALGSHSTIVERYYSRGIYIGLRQIADTLDFLFFLPGILWAIALLIVLPIVLAVRRRRRGIKSPHWRTIINILGWIIALFYWLWAYNYQRIPYLQQTGMELIEIDTSMLIQEAERVVSAVNDLRSSSDFATHKDISYHDLEDLLSEEMSALMSEQGYPADYRVSIAKWQLKGALLRWSTAGIYIPHALQGNVDGGLHELQVPATASHEMTHAYGITHEGIANYLAYQACSVSENIYVQYSVQLGYMKHLFRELRYRVPRSYERFRANVSEPVNQDLRDILTQMDHYPDLMPQVRDAVYDQYLKTHGISEGIRSYNLLVQLVMSERYGQ